MSNLSANPIASFTFEGDDDSVNYPQYMTPKDPFGGDFVVSITFEKSLTTITFAPDIITPTAVQDALDEHLNCTLYPPVAIGELDHPRIPAHHKPAKAAYIDFPMIDSREMERALLEFSGQVVLAHLKNRVFDSAKNRAEFSRWQRFINYVPNTDRKTVEFTFTDLDLATLDTSNVAVTFRMSANPPYIAYGALSHNGTLVVVRLYHPGLVVPSKSCI